MKKHFAFLVAGILLVLIVSPARLAHAVTNSTVTVASSPAWGGQLVCLNDAFPPACPAGATKYGAPFIGWLASRPQGANWIWLKGVTGDTLGADLATASFSQTIRLNGAPVAGQICLAADDFAQLKVNGAVVGSVGSTTNVAVAAAAQNTCQAFNVTPFLKPGANDFTVNGQNGPKSFSPFQFTGCNPSCKYKENPAGVMFGGTLTVANPTTKEECKKGGFMKFGFENQGQCIRFVNTGKDSRTGG